METQKEEFEDANEYFDQEHDSAQEEYLQEELEEEAILQEMLMTKEPGEEAETRGTFTITPEVLERLRIEQNLLAGVIPAILVGLVGALLWGVITVATGYQIGYMAMAIGAGVGLAMRWFGKGIDKIFGICGAIIALLSCLLGNFFSIIGFLAHAYEIGYWEMFTSFDYSYLPELIKETFSAIDLLFYGIALYEGYRFSFRKITEKTFREIGMSK